MKKISYFFNTQTYYQEHKHTVSGRLQFYMPKKGLFLFEENILKTYLFYFKKQEVLHLNQSK